MSDPATPEEIEELRRGLAADPPEVPSKHLYDDRGSRLFEDITGVEEYYPTRTEEAILETHADDIVAAVRPRELVELGSGAGHKIRLLLDAMGRAGLRERCVFLEINELFVEQSTARLREAYPDLEVRGIVGDFEHDLPALGEGGDRLVLMLAGTIGNLRRDEAADLLRGVRRQLAPDDGFLVGFDLVKSPERIVAAYDDAAGVTAAFNKNVLQVLNRRFGAAFDPEDFDHVAHWNEDEERIEMRLRARRDVAVRIEALDTTLELAAGEDLRTELSCKYTRERVEALAAAAGYRVTGWYTDDEPLFVDALLTPA